MPFIFKQEEFPDVSTLTQHLSQRHETTSEINFTPLDILLEHTDPLTPEHIKELTAFILASKRTRLFNIQFISGTPPNEQLRRATTYVELRHLSADILEKNKKVRESQAKLDLLNKKRTSAPIQILHVIPNTSPAHIQMEMSPKRELRLTLRESITTSPASTIDLPDYDQFKQLFPLSQISRATFNYLLQKQVSDIHIIQFLKESISPHQTEIEHLLSQLNEPETHKLIAKLLILGGDKTVYCFLRLVTELKDKQFNLDFLKGANPDPIHTFVSPQGLKNLQSLAALSQDKREWWQAIVKQHLENPAHLFELNTYFSFFSKDFLAPIAELGLAKLPMPCPITRSAPMLETLPRIVQVLQNAKNHGKQTFEEQCQNLAGLDWSEHGAAYATTQSGFGYINREMELHTVQDTDIHPESINLQDNSDIPQLWYLRFFAKHWKEGVTFTQIENVKKTISTLSSPDWTPRLKKQLLYIITCTFASPGKLTNSLWQTQINEFIGNLSRLPFSARAFSARERLIPLLTCCYQFKPHPASLQEINHILRTLIQQLPDPIIPERIPEDFFSKVAKPIIDCYLHENAEIIPQIQLRLARKDAPGDLVSLRQALVSLPQALDEARAELQTLLPDQQYRTDFVKLMASLNHNNWRKEEIIDLARNVINAGTAVATTPLIQALAQINLVKSSQLPDLEKMNAFLISDEVTPLLQERDTQKIIQQLNNNSSLDGCAFGEAQLSQLSDLVLEAIVQFFKNNAALSETINNVYSKEIMQNAEVPDSLRTGIKEHFEPTMLKLKELKERILHPQASLDLILTKMSELDAQIHALFGATYTITKGFFTFNYPGVDLFRATTTGNGKGDLILKIFAYKGYPRIQEDIAKCGPLRAQRIEKWLREFCDSQSILTIFQDELIVDRVMPTIRKILEKLETSEHWNQTINQAVAQFDKNQGTSLALGNYNQKLQIIKSLLNTLVIIKNNVSPDDFQEVIQLLSHPGLKSLSFQQQDLLLSTLYQAGASRFLARLRILPGLLEARSQDLRPEDINRALQGLTPLFQLDYPPEEQDNLLRPSFNHNLNSSHSFPFEPIITLQKLPGMDSETKNQLLKQFINLLQSPNLNLTLLTEVIQQTGKILSVNPAKKGLVLSLLKQIDPHNLTEELQKYRSILACGEPLTPSLAPATYVPLSTEQKEQITHIMTCLTQVDNDEVSLELLLDIMTTLRERREQISIVRPLFDTLPHPSARMLSGALKLHLEKLNDYAKKFDLNPFAKPNEVRPLAQHFSMRRAGESIQALNDLKLCQLIPYELQLQLAQRLNHINEIGRNICVNLSREELKIETDKLIKAFQTKQITSESPEFEHTQHQLLAYLRELYYRTTCSTDSQGNKTGLFANSTQMLALLLSFYFPQNLLMQIKTGEGKSILTPLLSVLAWSQGGTVDICTANTDLLERDFNDNYLPIFSALKIESRLIRAKSKPEEYIENGINCSTLKEMGLFRMSAAYHKKPINPANNQTHLVLDEVDTIMDKVPILCLAYEASNQEDKDSISWVYPLVYDFIHTDEFKQSGHEEKKQLEALISYFYKHPEVEAGRKQQLSGMQNIEQFMLQAFNAACRVELLEEEQDYILLPQKETIDGIECVTRIDVMPATEANGIFADGWQAALLTKLQKEKPGQKQYFAIPNTPSILAYLSIQHLIQSYQKTAGRLMGISGTIGAPLELRYLATQYKVDAIDIPSHEGNRRKEHEPRYSVHRNDTIETLFKTIEHIRRPYNQPVSYFDPDDVASPHSLRWARRVRPPAVLIVTQDIKEAREYKDAIETWSKQHATPICFIVDDHSKLQKFREACHEARDTIGMPDTKMIPMKIISPPEDPAILEHLKKQGFCIQCATGDETRAKIIERLKTTFYQVQFVDGKETREELKQKIRQASETNTITIGPDFKLGRGVDIKNTYQHAQGVWVIPTALDRNKRMKGQIAGRVARNGGPGHVHPHYQISLPNVWWKKILFYIFPPYRRYYLKQLQKEIEAKLDEEAAVEKLYAECIDAAQQKLMAHFDAWCDLFLNNQPNQTQLALELLQYRGDLLNEVRNYQSTTVNKDNLENQRQEFETKLHELWETFKINTLMPKYQGMRQFNARQKIGFPYLASLSLKDELLVQSHSTELPSTLATSTKPARELTVEIALANKAGCSLTYEDHSLSPERREQLQQEEIKQVFPHLIDEVWLRFPDARNVIKEYFPDANEQTSTSPLSFIATKLSQIADLFKRFAKWVKHLFVNDEKKSQARTVEQKNLRIAEIEKKSKDWPIKKYATLLNSIKEALDRQMANTPSIVEKFKIQNLLLSTRFFSSNSEERVVREGCIETHHPTEKLMNEIAKHIRDQLDWVKNEPRPFNLRPFHINIEREEVIKAALATYQAAQDFLRPDKEPGNGEENQKFYQLLQKQYQRLKPLTILSLGHINPRTVLHDAIDAIDVLTCSPLGCEKNTRQKAKDAAILETHLEAFAHLLESKTLMLNSSKKWHTVKQVLEELILTGGNELGTLFELQACVTRFQHDERYTLTMSALVELHAKLNHSIQTLIQPGVLTDMPDVFSADFLAKQSAAIKARVDGDVKVETGFDGLHRYVEVRLNTDAPVAAGSSKQKHYSTSSRTQTALATAKENLHTTKDLFKQTNKSAFMSQLLTDQVIQFIPKIYTPQLDEIREIERFRTEIVEKLTFNTPGWIARIADMATRNTIQQLIKKLRELKNYDLNNLDIPSDSSLDPELSSLIIQHQQIDTYLKTNSSILVKENALYDEWNEKKILAWFTQAEPPTRTINPEYFKSQTLALETSHKNLTRRLQDETHTQKSALIAHLDRLICSKKQSILDACESDFKIMEETILDYEAKEKSKARTTTLRFFNQAEFFDFKAELTEEKKRTAADTPLQTYNVFNDLFHQGEQQAREILSLDPDLVTGAGIITP